MGLGLSFGFSMCSGFLAPFWGQPGHRRWAGQGLEGQLMGRWGCLHQLVLRTLKAYAAEAASAAFLASSHRLPGTQEAVLAQDLT